jgi:hypothetical protein
VVLDSDAELYVVLHDAQVNNTRTMRLDIHTVGAQPYITSFNDTVHIPPAAPALAVHAEMKDAPTTASGAEAKGLGVDIPAPASSPSGPAPGPSGPTERPTDPYAAFMEFIKPIINELVSEVERHPEFLSRVDALLLQVRPCGVFWLFLFKVIETDLSFDPKAACCAGSVQRRGCSQVFPRLLS